MRYLLLNPPYFYSTLVTVTVNLDLFKCFVHLFFILIWFVLVHEGQIISITL